MKKLKHFQRLFSAFSLFATFVSMQVSSQSTICSAAMTRSISPCINYLMPVSASASSPTEACCNSLRNLMSNGQDCLCLIVAGVAPFQPPLNQPLAMSLPRLCRMSGIAVECRATTSPISAPDEGLPSPRGDDDDYEEQTPTYLRPTLFPSSANSSHTHLPSLFIIFGIFICINLDLR